MTEPTLISDVIPPMRHYIGTKTLRASPMTRAQYVAYRGWPMPEGENPSDEGYLVEYDPTTPNNNANDPRHAGYISWSPADVFEHVYSEIPREAEPPTPAPAQPAPPIPRMPRPPVPFIMLPYQQRVVDEHTELTERLGKLIAFSSSNVFLSLPGAERTRMLQQAALMQALSEVLAERINAFEPTAAC